MNTKIVHFDETGDDGNNTNSSNFFTLTSMYMDSEKWLENFIKFKTFRNHLREQYGFSLKDEMHTQPFMTDKNPYRQYGWTYDQRKHIYYEFTNAIAQLDISFVNVIINKTLSSKRENYQVLKTALTYNIQRIENSSRGEWNYIMITDPGRTGAMRKTAREIRAYNPIPSHFFAYQNQPIQYMVEDILEKDSKDSYFIQICDFMSYFASMYFKIKYLNTPITGRASNILNEKAVDWVMDTLKNKNRLNLKASSEKYGLVIYPKH